MPYEWSGSDIMWEQQWLNGTRLGAIKLDSHVGSTKVIPRGFFLDFNLALFGILVKI